MLGQDLTYLRVCFATGFPCRVQRYNAATYMHLGGTTMAKYLFQASYTADGAKGLIHDGGTVRKAAVEKLMSGLGGTLEAMYFAFGDTDVYAIVDLPDHESAVAASVSVAASGAVTTRTVVLVTPEQIDAAAQKSVDYRRPGAA